MDTKETKHIESLNATLNATLNRSIVPGGSRGTFALTRDEIDKGIRTVYNQGFQAGLRRALGDNGGGQTIILGGPPQILGGALDGGAIDDGVLDDGALDDGALDDGVIDDGVIDDGDLEDWGVYEDESIGIEYQRLIINPNKPALSNRVIFDNLLIRAVTINETK